MVRLLFALLLWTGIGNGNTWEQTLPPQPGSLIGATYQPFEHGFMVWNAIDSEVWIYQGNVGGQLTALPSWMYGEWEADQATLPPAGRFRPENGFGRVWNTFAGLRESLGWATSGEQGYLLQVQHNRRGELVAFTLPDGHLVKKGANGWWLPGGIYVPPMPYAVPTDSPFLPTPFPTMAVATIPIAFQCFQNGFMIGRSDTGMIYVLFDQTNWTYTSVREYPQSVYEHYPEAVGTSPDDRLYLPLNSFGKVWAGDQFVRDNLGWATSTEEAYPGVLGYNGSVDNIRIQIPGGGAVDITPGYWSYPSLGNTHGCP